MSVEHGGMPPKRLESSTLPIARSVVKSTGERRYNTPRFIKGAHNLWVFVNGKKEFCGSNLDYIEISNDTIEFVKHIPKGAVIEFLVIG